MPIEISAAKRVVLEGLDEVPRTEAARPDLLTQSMNIERYVALTSPTLTRPRSGHICPRDGNDALRLPARAPLRRDDRAASPRRRGARVPLHLIKDAAPGEPVGDAAEDEARITPGDTPNVLLTLSKPLVVRGFLGVRRRAKVVRLYVDDPAAFLARLGAHREQRGAVSAEVRGAHPGRSTSTGR